MKKRGLSPVIATSLLIAIVVVLAAIIFLWARGFINEQVAKFDEPVERACNRVNFQAGIFNNGGSHVLDINNRGDVPIYGFQVKEFGGGSVIVNDVGGVGGNDAVLAGESRSISLTGQYSQGSRLLVVPVILGEAGDGRVAYTCPDEIGVGVE